MPDLYAYNRRTTLVNTKFILIAAALMLSASAVSAGQAAGSDKPFISASQAVQMTALVEAIDYASREVVLRGPEGKLRTITASPDAQNLDQVKPGDQVNVEIIQNISVEVVANDGTEPGRGSLSAVGRAKKGEEPGMVAMDTQLVSAVVENINIEANTFKLRWPDGSILEYEARDPENLKKADVGDLVVISYTEAIAVSVESAPGE
jgi:hypothetical protein